MEKHNQCRKRILNQIEKNVSSTIQISKPDRVLLASNAQVSPPLRFVDPLCPRCHASPGSPKPLAGSHLSPIITPETMRRKPFKNIQEESGDKRTVSITMKVSASQKERIDTLARQCGETRSTYLLQRAFGYKPKARLTNEERIALKNLMECRTDAVNFANALKALTDDERIKMFRRHSFMIAWLDNLNAMADRVLKYLDSVKRPNSIPE